MKLFQPKSIQYLTVLILVGSVFVNRGFSINNEGTDIVQPDVKERLEKKLTPIIQKLMDSYDLPGLAIGVVKDDQIVYAQGFGRINIETNEPITTETIFHMASISKPFVATAIMQLVEQGKIDLNAPLIQYLPYFQLADDRYKTITIQQMLCHMSGMPDVEDYEWEKPQYDEGALERYVRSLTGHSLKSEPGEKYAYSNMAFECLGDVIAKVSGISFADYVKKRILDPSGMKESSFHKPKDLPENWAAPHLRVFETSVWDGYPYNRMHGPSSTLHSNILEMCNWAMINIHQGTYNNQKILNASSYDLLWKPFYKKNEYSSTGLSWSLAKYREFKAVAHAGGDTGFKTNLVILPDQSAAVVVLCNINPSPVLPITYATLDLLLGFEPRPIKAPALIQVGRIMKKEGVKKAVAKWNLLKENHPDQYDFGPGPFFGMIMSVVQSNQIDDARNLASLMFEVMPREIMQGVEAGLKPYFKGDMDNQASVAFLDVIRTKMK